MRIRKNAKILQQLSTTTSPSSITTLTRAHLQCQLNQSPWDIITFPPSDSSSFHFQEDEDFGFPGNGSFGDSIQSPYSGGSISMKTCMESEEVLNTVGKPDFFDDAWEDEEEEEEEGRNTQVGFDKSKQIIKEEEEEEEEDDEVVLCSETDGKGWQCGRVVKNGQHKMCTRHLKNSKILGGKQSEGTCTPPPARRGRGRPRTKNKEPTKNPNEYYYYSGFGPLWGKKKGPGRVSDDATSACINDLCTGSGSVTVKNNHDTATNVSLAKSSVVDGEIDYMECDDDDDDDEVEQNIIGKKRGRKMIKARSLKSLM